jgi:hypothetical protein
MLNVTSLLTPALKALSGAVLPLSTALNDCLACGDLRRGWSGLAAVYQFLQGQSDVQHHKCPQSLIIRLSPGILYSFLYHVCNCNVINILLQILKMFNSMSSHIRQLDIHHTDTQPTSKTRNCSDQPWHDSLPPSFQQNDQLAHSLFYQYTTVKTGRTRRNNLGCQGFLHVNWRRNVTQRKRCYCLRSGNLGL